MKQETQAFRAVFCIKIFKYLGLFTKIAKREIKMVEQDKLFESKIKHKGIFDFKELYNVLYTWLVDQGYDVNEKSYKENIGAGGAKEVEIKWVAYRKISDYFRFVLKVEWRIIGLSNVEVEIEGVKTPMNRGNAEIKVSSVLEKDYESRWENRPFFKFLRTLYDRYLIPGRIEQYEGKLLGEMDEFIAQIKSFLSLLGKQLEA